MDIRTEPAGMNLDWELRRLLEVDAWLPPAFYSTTWDGAGQVIEEMQRRGWELALNVTGVGVAASFHRQGSYHPFKFFIASYGPFVITIAAILALRSEADHEPPELDK